MSNIPRTLPEPVVLAILSLGWEVTDDFILRYHTNAEIHVLADALGRQHALLRQIDAVHAPDLAHEHCTHDRSAWPCETIRLIRGPDYARYLDKMHSRISLSPEDETALTARIAQNAEEDR